MQPVDATISSLRLVVGAKNDAELAKRLEVDQSTISSWRARGRIPRRFEVLLEVPRVQANPKPPEVVWPELQDRATAVALARFVLLRNDLVFSGDVDAALAAFLDLKPFWLVMNRAVFDLRAKMAALKIDLSAAAALVLQDDLRDPSAALARVSSHLSEDMADNPWLEGWKPLESAVKR